MTTKASRRKVHVGRSGSNVLIVLVAISASTSTGTVNDEIVMHQPVLGNGQ
jgi:hypothetical protein